MSHDYFYGAESDSFSFYRVPRLLVTGDEYKRVSAEAKLLYGLLLDRMGLSARNGWYDEQDRVYIYYTLDEVQEDLNCGHEKAVKLLAELDTGKGIGLIERVKQGQGKPTRIYVKRFADKKVPSEKRENSNHSRLPNFGSQEVGKTEVKTSDFRKSRVPNFGSADFRKTDASYNNIIYTDSSYTDPSIYPSGMDEMDRRRTREDVKEQIDYDILKQQYPCDDVDCFPELMTEVLCSTAPTMRIGGEDISTMLVQDRFRRLDFTHIEYVIDAFRKTATKIHNIRAYLLTALYNAPVTIGPFYSAEVRHDSEKYVSR